MGTLLSLITEISYVQLRQIYIFKSTLFSLCHINLSATVPQILKGHSKEKGVPRGTESRSQNHSHNSKHSFVQRPQFKSLLMLKHSSETNANYSRQPTGSEIPGPLNSQVRGAVVTALTRLTQKDKCSSGLYSYRSCSRPALASLPFPYRKPTIT